MGRVNESLGKLLGNLDATAEVPAGASKADIIDEIANAVEGGGGDTAYRIDIELTITNNSSASVSSVNTHGVAVTDIATALSESPESTSVVVTLASNDNSYPIVCRPSICPRVLGEHTQLFIRILGVYENGGGDVQIIDAALSIGASGGQVKNFSRTEV